MFIDHFNWDGVVTFAALTAEKCYVEGGWTDCEPISVDLASSYDDCLTLCKENITGCTHFTFSPATSKRHSSNPALAGVNVCETYKGPCGDLSIEGCEKCKSGESSCSPLGDLECEAKYCCHGKVIKIIRNSSYKDCRNACNNDTNCQWYSFYSDTGYCHLMDGKGNITDEGTDKCQSGQHGCQDSAAPTCSLAQVCDGNILAPISPTATAQKCLDKCKSFKPAEGSPECGWVSYHNPDRLCYLFDTCDGPFEAGDYISGEKRCPSLPGEHKYFVIFVF